MSLTRRRLLATTAALLVPGMSPVSAEGTGCDIAVLYAIDCSYSGVTIEQLKEDGARISRRTIQVAGIANAIRSIPDALFAGQGVWVGALAWGSQNDAEMIADWVYLDSTSHGAAQGIADTIQAYRNDLGATNPISVPSLSKSAFRKLPEGVRERHLMITNDGEVYLSGLLQRTEDARKDAEENGICVSAIILDGRPAFVVGSGASPGGPVAPDMSALAQAVFSEMVTVSPPGNCVLVRNEEELAEGALRPVREQSCFVA